MRVCVYARSPTASYHDAVQALGARFRLGPELEVPGYSCEDHFYEADTEVWPSLFLSCGGGDDSMGADLALGLLVRRLVRRLSYTPRIGQPLGARVGRSGLDSEHRRDL